MTVFKYGSMGLFMTIVVEHICRKRECQYSPSKTLTKVANGMTNGFGWLGEKFAKISSFTLNIRLGEFGDSAMNVIAPITSIVSSWWKFFYEYYVTAKETKKSKIIYFGSFFLIGSLWMVHRKFNNTDWRNFCIWPSRLSIKSA
jgi:hypothetical protein